MARKLDSRDNQEPSVSDTGESPSGEERSILDRRTYIKLGSAAISALSAVTVGGALTGDISRHGIEFSSSRNAVDDLGMDPTGEEPIDEALGKTADGDLIRFPDGTYRFGRDSGLSIRNETRGFEGIGDNVALHTSRESTEYFLDAHEMDGVYVSGVDFDQRGSDSCLGVRLTGDRVVLKGMKLVGGPNRLASGGPLLSHATESSDENSLVENVVATAGCENQPPLGRPGIFLEQSHEGTLTVRNCDLRKFPNAAVHSTRHSGTVRVVDSHFEDNASAIRFSNSGSQIERSEIVVTERPPSVPRTAGPNPYCLHGIAAGRGGDKSVSHGPLVVVNSTIRIEEMIDDWPAVVTPSLGAPVELRECEILFHNDGQSVISAESPGPQSVRPTRRLSLRNSVVRGSGTVNSVIVATNADGSTIADSSLQLAGGDGITFQKSEECDIERTSIAVPGRAGVFRASSLNALEITPSQSIGPDDTLGHGYPHQFVVGGHDTTTTYTFSADTVSPKTPQTGSTDEIRVAEADTQNRYRFAGALAALSLEGSGTLSFSAVQS